MNKRTVTIEFCFFAMIGSIAFFIDFGLFTLLHQTLNYAQSRAISILFAMTFTWIANRTFTFSAKTKPTYHEWLKYFSINMIGALINYSIFLSLTHNNIFLKEHYFIPLLAATSVSMWFNFGLSRRLFTPWSNIP